ncbi:hypothetical protein [Luteimonas sp. R10]|uniref:hypothetical protein n=1 Tax=Luteimonas sp. R10 TaxID=3108176 RepID=UPI003089D069|nr:hypothetical protein U3649_17140 [Luteimonas sp. R10]
MPKPIASILLLVLLAACGAPAERPAAAPVTGEAECLQRGGQWTQLGRASVKQCLLQTTDAGAACTDSDQCEGLCLAPEGSGDGTAVGGTCSADTNRFGCRQRVTAGVAVTLCVD